MQQDQIEAILRFWFGAPGSEEAAYSQRRKLWFGKRPEFDQAIRQQFQSVYQQAAIGEFDTWQATPLGCLALIILLDQFPRNMFRNSPQAFATDEKALKVAQHAIETGFDQQLAPIQRMFVYLPFEHSEEIENQKRSVELSQQLCRDAPELTDVFEYAERHRLVIERFGRFPHRNRILGRASTPEELEFLQQPGSSF
jgi:uncharacterized protein (DUF924 family)